MTFAGTIAKSQELDRALARPLGNGSMVQEIGGKKLVGELGTLFESIKTTVAAAKLGIAAAGAELVTEVEGLKAVETAIRSETASVRAFKTNLLGNATGGENLEEGKTE